MSLKKYSQKKNDHLVNKRTDFRVKITTYTHGKLKNDFIDDCIKRNDMESSHARNIINLYYSVMDEFPHLKEKEFSEIKLFLIRR
jgi:hypothetical protein